MADNADIANDLAQWRIDLAIKAHKPHPIFESFPICIDCDDQIPMARRIAAKGCTRCAECQGITEKLGARHAR